MRLKRLELHGFKTFASKTAFEFPTGITAVVGPNGSGKSNIADSVRWVLGEQAFSLMRGKRTDDMIFAGTELRPRMGMATASLTLDNSDGTLPIDFSEVTVTRRAFRSGENEYLLNGNRVRLRDINELLSRVGLSERTYAVLGQGLIDQALSLKAEERRAIIEEAAGISLYQSKRDDALRRLDATQRNLERVQDILAEIGPRMRSLERQARRAQEVGQVQADLESLLRVWYGYHWTRAKVALRAARREHEVRFADMAERRAALETLDKEMTAVRSEAGDLRMQLGALHRESSVHHGRAEALQRELAVREERIRALRAQREEVLTELVSLQAETAVQAERVAQAQAESDRLEAERRERAEEVEQARTVLIDREAERNRLNGIAEAARREAQRLAAERAARRARSVDLEIRAQALEADTTSSREALAAREAELAALREDVARAEAVVGEMAVRAAELGAARQSGDDQLALVENELRALAARRAQAEADEGRLHDRRILLERMRQDLEGTSAGARAVLRAARSGILQGVRGTLAEVLRVPAPLERAAEAVLGPDVDAVVADSWQAAEAALAESGGAVTVYALDTLRPNRPLVAPAVPFVTGNLAQLLMNAGQDPCYEPLIYTLFGRALLVRGRADALRLRRYLPPDSQVVTSTGERLTHGGAYTSAPVASAGPPVPTGSGTGGALAREREWRELPDQIEAAAAQRREVAEALEAQEAIRVEWRRTLDDIVHALETLAGEQRDAQNDLQARHRALDRLAHETEVEAARLTRQAEETADLRSQAQRLAVEADGLVQSQDAAEARLREAQDQLAALAEGADVLTTRVAQAERAAAVAGEAVRRHAQLLRDQQNALALLEQRGSTRHQRAAALESDAAALVAANRELQGEEAALAAALEELRRQIAPAEERLQALEHAQAQVESAEAGARTQLHASEARATQAQLDLSLRQEELENLRRHILEDLGLVELDLDEDITGQAPLPLDPLVTRLPHVAELPPDHEAAVHEKRAQLRRMGAINPDAPAEFAEVSERHHFLSTQVADLTKAIADLQQVIAELDEMTKRDFRKTFDAVNAEFKEMFTRLFGGGAARLELSDPDDLVHTGIDVIARPPGKRLQPLALLSGGERALTAAALIFALLRVSPPPFCILDEVDAALDESNVVRFRDMLLEFQQQTQFIVITHNRGTMYAADTFYGITMSADGSSAAYSVRLVGDQIVHAK